MDMLSTSTRRDESAARDRDVINQRLRELGIQNPYIHIANGTKQSTTDHTDPANQYALDDLVGSYGIMPLGSLAIVDIDTRSLMPDDLREWIEANPTLTVESPHEGRHLYFDATGDIGDSYEDWGELRADGCYVVGPGSSIDHEGCGGCAYSGEGRYEIIANRPIATVDGGTLREFMDLSTGEAVPTYEIDTDGEDTTLTRVYPNVDRAKEAKHGDRFTALWNGEYREVGHVADDGSADRSTAEAELVMRLAFWLHKKRSDVANAMDRACRENPRTGDGQARKWLARRDGYRDSTLDLISEVDNTYEGSVGVPGWRPDVSKITSERVLDAVLDLGLATSAEITEHESVDRSRRQVRRALSTYKATGVVSEVRDGRRILYYGLDGSFLTDEQREFVARRKD
jgi:DNA-binding transcriptional ArsR family regulator